MENCRIGENCKISALVSADNTVIGDDVEINAKMKKDIQLEDIVIMGGHAILNKKLKINFGTKIDAYSINKTINDLKNDS